ncbi:hypothetical protein FQA47_002788 [Oryzias melastigma]|uniref:Uncharacterized protein n=1 Tax=Oryzias melastigma TaxID=30732 RepID=A0A834F4C5_ORYME|nr:hypothetical protein FQA47_002788 [Oryzias melastigma]
MWVPAAPPPSPLLPPGSCESNHSERYDVIQKLLNPSYNEVSEVSRYSALFGSFRRLRPRPLIGCFHFVLCSGRARLLVHESHLAAPVKERGPSGPKALRQNRIRTRFCNHKHGGGEAQDLTEVHQVPVRGLGRVSAVHAHGARGQEHLRLSSAAPPPCLLLQEILSFTVMMGGSPVCRFWPRLLEALTLSWTCAAVLIRCRPPDLTEDQSRFWRVLVQAQRKTFHLVLEVRRSLLTPGPDGPLKVFLNLSVQFRPGGLMFDDSPS